MIKDLSQKKVIIGAAGFRQAGFEATDEGTLNILKKSDWQNQFYPESISCLLAEHVFEHLSLKEIKIALKNCYKYLKRGGRIRIAVPDKNRKDLLYIKEVKPPRHGHKSYLSHYDLAELLKQVGFKVKKLEYYDDNGKFIHLSWDIKYGKIRRSIRFDKQKKFRTNNHNYTSLIVDGIKP